MSSTLEALVKSAQNGDQAALENVVRAIQDTVHHLAMRMLVNPADALDATQEILILIITRLSTFRGSSAFQTWVYRVAANYLSTAKKIASRDRDLNFESFRADLEADLVADRTASAEDGVLLNELRISCTMAMLLCLDMNHRVAYVLGDILEFDHTEAAAVLDISKEAYRKRLSRARAEVVAFTSQSCGLVSESAKCACPRRLPAAMKLARVQPNKIAYAVHDAPSYAEALQQAAEVQGALRTLKLQQSTPHFASPQDFGTAIAQIVRDRC